jgi:hypothetical protein
MAPGLAVKAEIVPKEKGLNADPGSADVLACRMPGTHQVANGFMQGVRNPNVGEFAGAEQSREGDRTPAIILDPIPGPARRHRWGANPAGKAKAGQLPLNVVAARPRLVDEFHGAVSPAKSPRQLRHRLRCVADSPEPSRPASATAMDSVSL